MRWSRALTCVALTMAAPAFAEGDVASTCHPGRPFVQLYFVGGAWPAARKRAVLHELGIELRRRRALDVCASPEEGVDPRGVVTLLANDPDRISIVPFRLQNEGTFTGRTIELGPIPEDARALAIAQAVDEVLLGEAPLASRPAPAATAPASTPSVTAAPLAEPPLRLALALGPALQIAPGAATGADRTALSTGLALRIIASTTSWGTSVGVTLPRSTELAFGSAIVVQHRTPFDFSLGLVVARRPRGIEALMHGGLVVALLQSEFTRDGSTQQRGEVGARLGFTAAYGDALVPWVGASVEIVPLRSEIRVSPVGRVGTTSSVWVGLAAGIAVRWPS